MTGAAIAHGFPWNLYGKPIDLIGLCGNFSDDFYYSRKFEEVAGKWFTVNH
jgi:hypothetical protein